MQVKLLRAIQEKKVRKVGATAEEPVDVRIISATHRNLADEVKGGAFRQDLYYRLNVIELKMPSLREMREDIPLLAEAILKRQCAAARAAAVSARRAGRARALRLSGQRARAREHPRARARARHRRRDRAPTICSSRRSAAGEEAADVAAACRCRSGSTRSSARRSSMRSSRRTTTAPPPRRVLGITFRALRYRMERLGIKDELDAKS